jgi:hypothetical protein
MLNFRPQFQTRRLTLKLRLGTIKQRWTHSTQGVRKGNARETAFKKERRRDGHVHGTKTSSLL